METIENEQEVKRPSQFLKPVDGSVIILQSHLVRLKTHYLNSRSTGVLCVPKDCPFCKSGQEPRYEYFYWGVMDKTEGVIRMPSGLFFSLNDKEVKLKKSKREVEWIISKSGEGKQTRYSATRGENVVVDEKVIEENGKKLVEAITKYEKYLSNKADELAPDFMFGDEPR